MRLFFIGLALAVSTAAQAQTFETRNFTQLTVFKSMQCELGLFALRAKREGIDPGLKAQIKYSLQRSEEKIAEVEAGLGGWLSRIFTLPKVGGSFTQSDIEERTIDGKLNINAGNKGACVGPKKDHPAIPLQINDCLTEGVPVILGGATTGCKKTASVKAKFDASGKFDVWVITLGPSFSRETLAKYTLEIAAPAPAEK